RDGAPFRQDGAWSMHVVDTADAVAMERRDGALRLSLVVPMFNEEASVDAFFDAALPVIREVADSGEIICIDDGSADATVAKVRARAASEPAIRLIEFTRNFGKEAALTAGFDHATGDAVVCIDADLQQPPATIRDMVGKWRQGWDIVGAKRTDREADSKLRGFFSRHFYRMFNRIGSVPIPAETSDFRLFDRAVVEALTTLPESGRFMKGLFSWVGFRSTSVDYVHGDRMAGQSSFRLWKLWNFALDGITAFSTLPLRVWSYVGVLVAAFAFLYGSFIILRTLIFGVDVPGYPSLLVVVLFLGGIQLISLGVLGEYVGRIMVETKRRPIYLVRRRTGFDAETGAAVDRAAE
ncbi:MAG: glycosyltransferase family 2 protein, partial [Pseudomonadota bacterium]